MHNNFHTLTQTYDIVDANTIHVIYEFVTFTCFENCIFHITIFYFIIHVCVSVWYFVIVCYTVDIVVVFQNYLFCFLLGKKHIFYWNWEICLFYSKHISYFLLTFAVFFCMYILVVRHFQPGRYFSERGKKQKQWWYLMHWKPHVLQTPWWFWSENWISKVLYNIKIITWIRYLQTLLPMPSLFGENV